VPTWAPFRRQFYCNGHNLLASQLKRKGIAFEMQDNAFLNIADFDKANQLAQQLDINKLHVRILGTRILHFMGPVAIKMYDKFGIILRIETTVNDVSFFKDYREVCLHGEFTISGFTARQMRPILPDKNAGQISRLVKRLRVHGLIKKIGRTYKYYLTQLGRQVAVMALKLRELYVIPALAQTAA
jgi:hypothetical protein